MQQIVKAYISELEFKHRRKAKSSDGSKSSVSDLFFERKIRKKKSKTNSLSSWSEKEKVSF